MRRMVGWVGRKLTGTGREERKREREGERES